MPGRGAPCPGVVCARSWAPLERHPEVCALGEKNKLIGNAN